MIVSWSERMISHTGTDTAQTPTGGCSRESFAMRESVTMRRCVEDDGLRVVNSCHKGKDISQLILERLDGTLRGSHANSVPAAAVIQRWRALFGFTGRKACVGGLVSRM